MIAILKKKISEEKISNIFINSILKLVESGFPEVAALINEAPEFITSPGISADDSDKFLMIVIAGNVKFLPEHFDTYREMRMHDMINRKFSHALELDIDIYRASLNKLHAYFNKINHPSKNTLYAMSKAVFYKYHLDEFQDEYFRKMRSPNPIFLKRLNEVMSNFIWDWQAVTEKYRIVP